jgi:2-polyprenyl-3-methyl-5-hydroxy-6-metoxy-1,4-benzoquinol methylase
MYQTEEGAIQETFSPDGKRTLTLVPKRPDAYIPRVSCETSFPPDLIEFIAARVPYAWVCDSIARHEDPAYLDQVLRKQLFAYFSPGEFRGKRMLDFGCGCGPSTLVMAKMLPETEFVGVELTGGLVEVAASIARFRQQSNAKFLQSPSGSSLPPGLGQFDFVMLSAVYEHLLPAERKTVMPLLWGALPKGGVLFVNQTPHRFFPYEHHSTMLWFINYMPDWMAHRYAQKCARHNPDLNRSPDWNTVLRGGIRGGTEREIIRNLGKGRARILQPSQNGLRDRADYWLSLVNPNTKHLLKRRLASVFRVCDRLWGTIPSINIDVAIQKTSA